MTFSYPPEEYMKQLKAYNELEQLSFQPEDSKELIISRLEERSAKKRVIADIANKMIREYLEPFEKNPEAMTPEDADALEGFEYVLLPNGSTVNNLMTDYSTLLRVGKILAGYFRRQEDWNRYADALNRCCVGDLLLYNAHSFSFHDSPFAEESIALARHLDGDELTGLGRTKALNCLTYVVYTAETRFPTQQLKDVSRILRSQMAQPPTEYEKRTLIALYANVLESFREYYIYARDHALPVDMEAAAPLLREAAAGIRDYLAQDKEQELDPGEVLPQLLTTDYFLGEISLETLLDELSEVQRKALESDNPFDQAFTLAATNHIYLTLLYKFSGLPREEIVRLSRERVRDVMPRLMKISRMVNNVQFNRCIVMFLNAASLTGSFDEFAEVILETTVYADKALFIHTAMVREMSRAIFDYMIERTPEVFDGVAGRDAAYIRSHKEEMKALLSDCCLYHDVGKFFMLDIVENSMRRLSDDEFALIKQHPGNFNYIYQVIDDRDERVLCIRDCALTHHLWHDGTRGYPNIPQTKNRPFADILAIADSIDAATDFLGRPYNSGKTIDQLIAEFQARAGTQYGPEAAAALSAPEVRDQLHYWITEGRKEIYYRIYAFNKL